MALEWLFTSVKSCSVVIFTDSLSALQMIDSYFIKCAIVNEILFTIHNLLSKDICVSFEWIPSHCDIHGNEIVDRAAKKGALKNNSDIILPNTRSELCCSSRLAYYKCVWQREWNEFKLNYYLFQIKQHSSGLCEVCKVYETIEHYTLLCSKYDKERRLSVKKK